MPSSQSPDPQLKPRKRSWSKTLASIFLDFFEDRHTEKKSIIEHQGHPRCRKFSTKRKKTFPNSDLAASPSITIISINPPKPAGGVWADTQLHTNITESQQFSSSFQNPWTKLSPRPIRENETTELVEPTELEEEAKDWLASLATENQARRRSEPSSRCQSTPTRKSRSDSLSSPSPALLPLSPDVTRRSRSGSLSRLTPPKMSPMSPDSPQKASNALGGVIPSSTLMVPELGSRGRKFRGKSPCSIYFQKASVVPTKSEAERWLCFEYRKGHEIPKHRAIHVAFLFSSKSSCYHTSRKIKFLVVLNQDHAPT
ncbi:uncharacterized protein MELLADRAFT_105459 [Melampsora larici-populina 98AG31]|uniref:Uncharacterized protein n=1 Tax=Melampsora larici-populina (strain 98AG31 / pathotype 3-4-7) TaxID=747676 RepID=F4RI72_MELLP|nr:uncharacterized protein MELLADRAFT_105459 [Melampsora larici-populina 98AG31]EGG07954.1 hypothetical protein MELLADRAFT_105459 [Melampsora larici-populina 98AG31]